MARMGDVYKKAYWNIAATGTMDGKTGFLEKEEEEEQEDELPVHANGDFEAYVMLAKPNTRGWVMQQRVLSRRTIHFATDMWTGNVVDMSCLTA
ncbi:uncharacterized protein EI97DRAFT_454863 [Westerdykella ornata]|uniref:Uncharacterized protein n=1 Tax=Westerdykella ornata TaxID=318751 RepID=A0A6A6JY13_WESOR|nr:uncharacterized protein EI97DRAFT_454863 [Westerdykella ornata]KAF2279919.1 hypothetical protein EI97DRAFT_454863 [Westerdykella ornata]